MAGSRADQEKALLQQIAQLSGLINAAKRQQIAQQQARIFAPVQPPQPASRAVRTPAPCVLTTSRPTTSAPRPQPPRPSIAAPRPTVRPPASRHSQPRAAAAPRATTPIPRTVRSAGQARPSHHKTWLASTARPPQATQALIPSRPALSVPPTAPQVAGATPAHTPTQPPTAKPPASRPRQPATPAGSEPKGHLAWARPGLATVAKAQGRRASGVAATVKLPQATATKTATAQPAQKTTQPAGVAAAAASRVVSIKGVHYVAGPDSLRRHTPLKQGEKEEGLPLRVSVQGRVFVRKGPGMYQAAPQPTTRLPGAAGKGPGKGLASKGKPRVAVSKATAQQYCMFYNRLGHCKNEGKGCRFVHDRSKVAVCQKFVRGTCDKGAGCLLLHTLDRDKMPVCLHFLRGACTRDDCPYSHVYVSPSAPVCQDFLRGYCPLGAQCEKKHTWDCPAFVDTGSCPDGDKCRMRHPPPPRKRQAADGETPASFRTKRPRPPRATMGPPPGPGQGQGEGRAVAGLEFLDDVHDGIILFAANTHAPEPHVEGAPEQKRLSLSFLDD